MPAIATPRTRAERREWARHIAADIRSSLPWWNVTERIRISLAIR